MANSLQDQLLKAGLIDENRLKRNAQDERKKRKQQSKRGKAPGAGAQAARKEDERAERDRELNRRRQEEAERKAVRAQIKQLIEASRLPKGDGEAAYNFTDGQKVKRLYLSDAVRQQLANGRARIVKLNGQYDVVPAGTAEKIAARDPKCVIETGEKKPDGDDPYAEFQVPDDLMW